MGALYYDLNSCRGHLLIGANFFSLVNLLTWFNVAIEERLPKLLFNLLMDGGSSCENTFVVRFFSDNVASYFYQCMNFDEMKSRGERGEGVGNEMIQKKIGCSNRAPLPPLPLLQKPIYATGLMSEDGKLDRLLVN